MARTDAPCVIVEPGSSVPSIRMVRPGFFSLPILPQSSRISTRSATSVPLVSTHSSSGLVNRSK